MTTAQIKLEAQRLKAMKYCQINGAQLWFLIPDYLQGIVLDWMCGFAYQESALEMTKLRLNLNKNTKGGMCHDAAE